MDNDKKIAFLQNMTHMALTHASKTPNVPMPSGGMSHDKMLSFVSQIANKGLQHFDSGGTVLGGPSGGGVSGGANTNTGAVTGLGNVATSLPVVGGVNSALGNPIGAIGSALTNNFQAGIANTQAGTNAAQLNNAYTGVQGSLTGQQNIVNQTQPGLTQGLGAQSTLSGQLANEAAGSGPNPAQAALNQNTGQNIAQQAALAAGQRGAGANVGLLAAQNAQQGAATQQQAVGQGATLSAEQQLAAQQQQAALASTQVGQGATAAQNLSQQQQNEQNILQGANTSYNNALVAGQSNANNVNAGVASGNQAQAGNIFGGALSGLSSAFSAFADGGQVGPGDDTPAWQNTPSDVSNGPSTASPASSSGSSSGGGSPLSSGISSLSSMLAKGGKVGGPQSHVGKWLCDGGMALAAKGGPVKAMAPGQKAVVKGDSLKNDKIPTMLSEGEVVMDKDTLADPGPVGKMARAVAAHIAARNKGKK